MGTHTQAPGRSHIHGAQIGANTQHRSGKRLSYKKNKASSGSSRNHSDVSSRGQSDVGSSPATPGSDTMDKAKMNLVEKRPSITEKELTPIVLNQLQNTKKHKDELRKARRGSAPKPEVPPPADLVSDSGAESCCEEVRIQTAEAFMTGIQTALTASIPDLRTEGQSEDEAGTEDIVTEVDNVLGKLLASLQRGETSMPELDGKNNLTSLISTLQATLKANVQNSPNLSVRAAPVVSQPQHKLPLNSIQSPALPSYSGQPPTNIPHTYPNPQQPFYNPVSQNSFQGQLPNSQPSQSHQAHNHSNAQTVTALTEPQSTVPNPVTVSQSSLTVQKVGGVQPGATSQIHPAPAPVSPLPPDPHTPEVAWKIRDTKKKRQKHITLGLTREEFAHIQDSLRHRPVKFTGVPPTAPYSLQRNKSDGHLLCSRLGDASGKEDLDPEDDEERGYVSDVCDYTADREQGPGVVHGKLKLNIGSEKVRVGVDGKPSRTFQADNSYVHPSSQLPAVTLALSSNQQPLLPSTTSVQTFSNNLVVRNQEEED